MNGISSDACIGLMGVMVGSALGFLGSVIVIWVEGREKTRSCGHLPSWARRT